MTNYYVTLIVDMPNGIYSENNYPDVIAAAKAAYRKGAIGHCRIIDDMGIDCTPNGDWDWYINHD